MYYCAAAPYRPEHVYKFVPMMGKDRAKGLANPVRKFLPHFELQREKVLQYL